MSKKFVERTEKAEEELKGQLDEMRKKMLRLGPVKLTLLIIFTIATLLSFVFYDYIFGAKTVFDRDWGSDFLNVLWGSVPKIVQCLQIVTVILLITTVILHIIKRSFTKTARGITVVQLISNLIKWVVAIVLIIAVLAVWGVDTTALITGAGVITLVVGLGLQSLIQDVVAGLFIIFENEFNVGDIITVDDFRGEVVSIGIRTTKLKAVGNIKIFNNSAITGILNQTVEPSTAKTLIDIEYGASLAKVEEIIRDRLPQLKINGALSAISYDGVATLGASGVTLQFTALCNEGDIYSVQRAMNGAIKSMFDENGIGIPFNQLVVHMADEGKGISDSYGETVDKTDECAYNNTKLNPQTDEVK